MDWTIFWRRLAAAAEAPSAEKALAELRLTGEGERRRKSMEKERRSEKKEELKDLSERLK